MPTVADQAQAPIAIQTHLACIFTSLELSRSVWLITSLSPGSGEKMSKHSVRWLRVSGTTEMPQIDQCVGHQFHTVVSLLFELEAQQQPLEFIFPREGPLHA